MKNRILILSIAVAIGCTEAIPVAPDHEVRTDALNLMATGNRLAMQVVAPSLSDSLELTLDSVQIVGLDAVVATWQRLSSEARIVQARFRVEHSDVASTTIVDSGTVVITDRALSQGLSHDSVLTFVASWRASGPRWQLRALRIAPRVVTMR